MKKVKVSDLKSCVKNANAKDKVTVTKLIDGKEISFEVRLFLSIQEQSIFVRRVLSGCFDLYDDFRPEYKEPMFQATVLQMFTNLPVISMKDESGGEDLIDIDKMARLFEILSIDISTNNQLSCSLDDLQRMVNEAIEWKKSRILAADSAPTTDIYGDFSCAMKALRKTLETIADKTSEVDIEKLTQMASALSEKVSAINENELVNKVIDFHRKEVKGGG